MAANIETMFYTRTAPWHGLGTKVDEALTSKYALIYAGLDWQLVELHLGCHRRQKEEQNMEHGV